MIRFEPVRSVDDNGWYVEVIDSVSGKTIHTTEVAQSVGYCLVEARKWCQQNKIGY